MKSFKRVIAACLILLCITGLFSGCNKSGGQTSQGGVKEYSLFLYDATNPYSEDMPIWKVAEEKTGIRLKNVISKSVSSESAAYSTMLAGGNMPDIIGTQVKNLRELAKDGGLRPLNDLIEKHAPNLKAFFEEYPEAVKYASFGDGNIYFIPGSINGMIDVPSQGYFIRQDWLDKLGLKTPTTIEEYHDVLMAFKTKDPNGNGAQDEVPYFSRAKSIAGLLSLFATSSSHFVNRDGEYEFGPITENYKTAMKTIAQWYKEGLIDKEIYTRNSAREQLLGQNLGGSTYDWFSSTTKFNDTFAETVPGIKLLGMLPPKNIDGKIESYASSPALSERAWGISVHADEDSLEELIKYFDFWMSEEGRSLMSYGVEGVSYTKGNDGEIVWSEEAHNYTSGIPNYLASLGMLQIGTIRDESTTTLTMNESGIEAYNMYRDILIGSFPSVNYSDEESDIVDKYDSNIWTALMEQQQKWVLGEEDVDATWDKYVKQLYSMGLQELMDATEAAYNRYVAE